jgi:hypothetical protein
MIQTSFLENKLFFYATNNLWENCDEIPVIDANELYEGQNYQALNIAKGYFKKIDVKYIASKELQKHDIVLTNVITIEVPVIAGIINTEFQTPLSHNRDTPNMVLKNGFEDENLDNLNVKLVHLKVNSNSYQ